jgi:hypothetical protein
MAAASRVRERPGPLRKWGNDARAFWDALSIVNPIDLGASFGGMVALDRGISHAGIRMKRA